MNMMDVVEVNVVVRRSRKKGERRLKGRDEFMRLAWHVYKTCPL